MISSLIDNFKWWTFRTNFIIKTRVVRIVRRIEFFFSLSYKRKRTKETLITPFVFIRLCFSSITELCNPRVSPHGPCLARVYVQDGFQICKTRKRNEWQKMISKHQNLSFSFDRSQFFFRFSFQQFVSRKYLSFIYWINIDFGSTKKHFITCSNSRIQKIIEYCRQINFHPTFFSTKVKSSDEHRRLLWYTRPFVDNSIDRKGKCFGLYSIRFFKPIDRSLRKNEYYSSPVSSFDPQLTCLNNVDYWGENKYHTKEGRERL